jgi:hypothetical protein
MKDVRSGDHTEVAVYDAGFKAIVTRTILGRRVYPIDEQYRIQLKRKRSRIVRVGRVFERDLLNAVLNSHCYPRSRSQRSVGRG